MLTLAEVAQHNSVKYKSLTTRTIRLNSNVHSRSCWVIIEDHVYDVTEFLFVIIPENNRIFRR